MTLLKKHSLAPRFFIESATHGDHLKFTALARRR